MAHFDLDCLVSWLKLVNECVLITCSAWNGLALAGIAIFYFPESQTRAHGKAAREILKKIDYVGGVLSISGIVLFLVALQAGGYSHPWVSAYVLVTLIVGLILIIAFVVWEVKFAPYPMVVSASLNLPRCTLTFSSLMRCSKDKELSPWHMGESSQKHVSASPYLSRDNVSARYKFPRLTINSIAFVAGMNFFALLNFFPLMFSRVFEPDPVQIGLKGIPPAFSTTFGAVFTNAALTWFKGHNRELLLGATILMTAFGGSLACVTPDQPKLAVALGTLAGFGVGGVLVPAATIAITVTPDTTIATCVSLSLAIRAIGGAIGYAIY